MTPVRMVKELQGGFSGQETVQRRTDTQLAALLEGLQVMVKETVSESMQHAMSGSGQRPATQGRRDNGFAFGGQAPSEEDRLSAADHKFLVEVAQASGLEWTLPPGAGPTAVTAAAHARFALQSPRGLPLAQQVHALKQHPGLAQELDRLALERHRAWLQRQQPQPQPPQPPPQPWVITPESLPPQPPPQSSFYLPPPPVAVSERPPVMSRLDLPTGPVTEQAASPRLIPPGKRMLPVGGGSTEAARKGPTEAAGGKDLYDWNAASGSKEERAVSSTPRDAALPEQEAVAVAECPHCRRTFLEARLAKHAPICQQAQARKRATPSKGTDGGKAEKAATPAEEKKALKWRNESANLRAAMEYNRKLAQAEKDGVDISTLPPPPAQADDDRVECPHCNRKFQADVADRHIPKCNAKGYPKRKPPPPPPPPPPPHS